MKEKVQKTKKSSQNKANEARKENLTHFTNIDQIISALENKTIKREKILGCLKSSVKQGYKLQSPLNPAYKLLL